MTESEKDAQARWILKKDLPMCVCKPTNPRHREAWRCVSKEQLAAWRAAEHPPVLRDETARRLASLWVNFSQHPEARRLSGRVVTLEESDKLNAYMALADHFGHDDATGTEWWQREM